MVPAELIGPNDNFITVKIDMININGIFYMKEAGTHDYFWILRLLKYWKI